MHSGVNSIKFKCRHCTYKFLTEEDRTKHETEKHPPNVCTFCGKFFKWRAHMMKHKREVHSDNRPFKCLICDSTFKRDAHLKLHNQRLHTNLQPWKCRYCDTTFRNSGTRKAHERKVHAKESENSAVVK